MDIGKVEKVVRVVPEVVPRPTQPVPVEPNPQPKVPAGVP